MRELGRRIMVVGSSGSGKSTLARKLGEITGLPVIHLDREYWQPGWVEPDKVGFIAKAADFALQERWIIDGYYSASGSIELRFQRADTVIFLDFNRYICLFSALKRWLTYLGHTRPDMAEGCPEKIDWEFVMWIWNFPTRSRPKLIETVNRYPEKTVTLQTRKEVAEFLEEL